MGVIDIGTGNSIRVRDLAPEDLPVKLYTPHERQHTLADITRIKKLGFKPKHISPRIEVIK